MLVANYTSDVFGSLIRYPEGSGIAGSGNYVGSRTTVMSTKLEYHGSGDRMLVDARESLLFTDGGGSNVDLVLREVSIAQGSAPPDPANHTIIQVGSATNGSDAIRIKQEGGWIEGVIKLGSAQQSTMHRRWSFRDAVRAPSPETVQFRGIGAHYMMEWRANENVRLDQYRGGHAAQVSIDSRKSLLLPLQGKYLIDGRVSGYKEPIAGRFGKDFTIDLPNTLRASGQMGGIGYATVAQLGLAVYVNNETGTHATDVQVQQYEDANFSGTPVGGATLTVNGGLRGLFIVHSALRNISDGKLHVRVTKPGPEQFTEGRLVFDYFPYLGV